jgi:hypothetical protein
MKFGCFRDCTIQRQQCEFNQILKHGDGGVIRLSLSWAERIWCWYTIVLASECQRSQRMQISSQ